LYGFKKFLRKKSQLMDDRPYGRLIDPGIVVNKDGSMQVTFRYRGPDLDSATMEELGSITQRLNHAMLRMGSGWVVYAEAQRSPSTAYGRDVYFTDEVTQRIDDERRTFFSQGTHFESNYYWTLFWMPPNDNEGKLKDMMIEGKEKKDVHYDTHIKFFMEETKKIFALLDEMLPEVEGLEGDEYLTYLHSVVSPKKHKVVMPLTPILLDSVLYDTPLKGGLEPMLGDYHLRVVVPIKYVPESEFGMFNALNRLDFQYRWVTKFICMDKRDAISEVGTFHRLWKGKQKSLMGLIKEMVTGQESFQLNENAVIKTNEASEARRSVEADEVCYGYYSTMIVILDKDREMVDRKARLAEQTLTHMGFTATTETLNSVDGWFGSIPGAVCNHVRRPMISTGNLVHMLPLSDIWAGPARNKHLNGPALIYTQTDGNTPFRLSLHVGDVGHTMMVGPTGAGKSVHLCMIAASFRKYKNAQVYVFDKGGSIRALTAGVGGNFYDLANEAAGSLSFQPLSQIDDENERTWASEWLYDFLREENLEITPEIKQAIWSALTALAASPLKYRTITGLMLLLQNHKIQNALQPLTIDGAYGRMFDSSEDNLTFGRWQVFEMETLMNTKAIVGPTLMYLFHRLEQQLDGSPTIIILDECWMLLDNPAFAAKIREWLKVLRKANASVIFATQSLADVAKSTIVDSIQDSCPTKIFLPNANAVEERTKEFYYTFGLNDKEIELISMGTPKKHYYYKSEMGSRLYDLALGKEALAYCAASSKEDQKMVRSILAEFGKEQFNEKWRTYKRMD